MWVAQRADGYYVSSRKAGVRRKRSPGSPTVEKAVVYKNEADAEMVAGHGGRAVKVSIQVDWRALPEHLPMGFQVARRPPYPEGVP